MESNINVDKNVVFTSLFWKVAERFFSQGLNLIVQIILARLLLPEYFGSLAIIVAVVNYAGLFVQSGLSTAIVQRKNLEEIDISTLLFSSLGVASILYIIIFAISPFIANYYVMPELVWTIRVLAIILFFNAINSIQTALYSRKMDFKALFFRSAFAVTISGAVGIVMAFLDYGLWALVAQNLLYSFVSVLVMGFRNKVSFAAGFSWRSAKELYSFSGKILGSTLLAGANDAARTMLIGKKYSSADLAYYDKANTYSYYIAQIVNSSLSGVLLPVFSRKQSDVDELRRISRKSVKMTAFIMFPVLFGLMAVSDVFVKVILTEKWMPCVPFLMVFCVLRIPASIVSIDKQVFLALGRSDIGFYTEIMAFIMYMCALFLTVDRGAFAIAIGVMIVEFVYGTVNCIISSYIYGYNLLVRVKDIIKPLVSALLMSGIILSIPKFYNIIYLVIIILFGMLLYLIFARLLKDDNVNEILKIVKNVLKR